MIASSRRIWGLAAAAVAAICLVAVCAAITSWFWSKEHQPRLVEAPPAPLPILSRPLQVTPDESLLRRGRYLAIAGDCVSCHTRAGGGPFNGGRGLPTPFGTIYTPDITGDRSTGLGNWTSDQFFRAMNNGRGADGDHLYPAFPFPHFTLISRQDSDAILAYLKSVPGTPYTKPANRLPFPVDLRISAAAWQTLFFRDRRFQRDASKSEAWNRGAYLVEGLGHCGSCHTPKNLLGAEDRSRDLQGAKLNNWVAPDLTSNARTGLGRWTIADIVEFLKTGRNAHSNAAGSMAEVISYSTSQLSDEDLNAMAVYLKSRPSSSASKPSAPSEDAINAGKALYFDACTACHYARGQGSPGLFPPLAGSAVSQQADPTTVIHLILTGGRAAPTPNRPSPIAMPAFDWKLSDREIANVATYIRNSWGNVADPVSADDVAKLRKTLSLPAGLGQRARMVSSNGGNVTSRR